MPIRPATSLDSGDMHQLYEIHRGVYFDKGIGHVFSTWERNLAKTYHGGPGKTIFTFDRSVNGRGYVISTDTVDFDGARFSKMLECATVPEKRRDGRRCFREMQVEFLHEMQGNADWVFGENGTDYGNVLEIFDSLGFHKLRDPENAESLLRHFLGDVDFSLETDDQGVIVNRRTAVNPHYRGYILMREMS